MNKVYNNLAKYLNNLPAAFPSTNSGVELRILKRLFSPKEAELAQRLTMKPRPVSDIAKGLDMEENELAESLESMSKKGLIIARTGKKGSRFYMAAQFVIGIWEYHVNNLDKELIRNFNEYVPYLIKDQLKLKTKQLRVIPVSKSISAKINIMPYENAEAIIKKQSKIIVASCICRKEHEMMGKGCGKPIETCLVFGPGAVYYEENKLGRNISQNEALEIINKGIEAGLVLQPGNSKKPINICLCCDCCCQILKNVKKLDKPALGVCSGYYAEINQQNCIACETCEESCPMDAISIDKTASVNIDRCIGCGLCVINCDVDAISLMEKNEDEKWIPPSHPMATYINIAKERKKFQ
ncbi:4Fe-4S ferredoxin [Candidatus Magnetomoraceae bacterium gMMP-15]